jgi:hypothetical protein
LPKAIAWAEARAQTAAETGESLKEEEMRIARAVGVARPDLVRIETVGERLPMPDDPVLKSAAIGYEEAPLEQDARAFERATGAAAP